MTTIWYHLPFACQSSTTTFCCLGLKQLPTLGMSISMSSSASSWTMATRLLHNFRGSHRMTSSNSMTGRRATGAWWSSILSSDILPLRISPKWHKMQWITVITVTSPISASSSWLSVSLSCTSWNQCHCDSTWRGKKSDRNLTKIFGNKNAQFHRTFVKHLLKK